MHGFTLPEEQLEGIQIYRHWISQEAGGFWGFFHEYTSALWGELRLAWKAWRRHPLVRNNYRNSTDFHSFKTSPRRRRETSRTQNKFGFL
jgi:hypothetical protein